MKAALLSVLCSVVLVAEGAPDGLELMRSRSEYNWNFLEAFERFKRDLMGGNVSSPDWSLKRNSGEAIFKSSRAGQERWKSPSCSELNLDLECVQSYNKLLYGNRVTKMRDRRTGKYYVEKYSDRWNNYQMEVNFFHRIEKHHPYFAKLVCHSDSRKVAMFEFIDGLESYRWAVKGTTHAQMQKFTAQLFAAMEHLHYVGIAHGDMKPDNVIVDRSGNVKVIDFGSSFDLPRGGHYYGSSNFAAPEVAGKVPGYPSESSDWWAFGSTIAIVFAGHYRQGEFRGRDVTALSRNYKFTPLKFDGSRYEAGNVPSAFPRPLRKFLDMFFQADVELRSFNTRRLLRKLRDHEFFKGFDWLSIHKYA